MIVRMADSLGWHVPPYESFVGRAEQMLANGYVLLSLPDPDDPRVQENAE
jgi:hypothetical protein